MVVVDRLSEMVVVVDLIKVLRLTAEFRDSKPEDFGRWMKVLEGKYTMGFLVRVSRRRDEVEKVVRVAIAECNRQEWWTRADYIPV